MTHGLCIILLRSNLNWNRCITCTSLNSNQGSVFIVTQKGKGRTIRKLTGLERGGGGWRAKYKKNIRARENSTKKNSCTTINPKKYSCYGLKKNSFKEFDNEKKIPAARKFPSSFSNGPSLKTYLIDIPHNYIIPQAMPHAIPQIHSVFYPHRGYCGQMRSKLPMQ